MCEELDEELFAWFVDTIQNVQGRLPAFLILEAANVILADLKSFHEQEKEYGRVSPHEQLLAPRPRGQSRLH